MSKKKGALNKEATKNEKSKVKDKLSKKDVKSAASKTPIVVSTETINLQPLIIPGSIVLVGAMLSLAVFFGLKASNKVEYSYDCDAAAPFSDGCLRSYAADLELDLDDFNTCLAESTFDGDIDIALAEGQEVGVQGTPATYLGKKNGDTFTGFYIGGGMDVEQLSDALKYADNHSVKELKEYWTKQQIADMDSYKQLVINWFSSADGGSLTGAELESTTKEYVDQRLAQIETESKSKLIEADLSKANVTGKGDTVLLEYSDYECPYCKDFAAGTLKEVKDKFVDNDKITFAFQDFPLEQIHQSSRKAANAARCAGDQDMYFKYHDKLFDIK